VEYPLHVRFTPKSGHQSNFEGEDSKTFLPLPLERRVMACPKAQNYTTTDLQSCDYINLRPAKWGSAIGLHGSKLLRLVMCFVGVLPYSFPHQVDMGA
jgi:hypothetical protein